MEKIVYESPKQPQPPTWLNLSHMAQRPDYQNQSLQSVSAKKIIEELNHAVTYTQRIDAIQTALHAFHHKNEQMHNFEFDIGAANALCLKLGYVLVQSGFLWKQRQQQESSGSSEEKRKVYSEIAMICHGLRLVYGCSVDRRAYSYNEIGESELIPLLVQILNGAADESSQITQQPQKEVVYRSLRVLRVFSKLQVAKHFMVGGTGGGLLTAIVAVLKMYDGQDALDFVDNASFIPLEAFGLVKDLTFRSSEEDKRIVFDNQSLMATMMRFLSAQNRADSHDHRLRENLSAILWNLAISFSVATAMTNQPITLQILTSLVSDEKAKTRRNSISAVGNLASSRENQERIMDYEEGALVNRLIKIAQEDEDTDCRRRAMRALRCLSSECSSRLVASRPDLVDSLVKMFKDEIDRDTKIQTCETLGYLSSENGVAEKVGGELVHVLESSSDRKLVLVSCKALSNCFAHGYPELGSNTSQPFYKNIEETILWSRNDAEAQNCMSTFLRQLASNEEIRKRMIRDEVFNSLAAFLAQRGTMYEDSHKDALHVISTLAATEANKKPMAEHEALLTALVNFAVLAPEGEVKDETKSLILELVPEL